MVAMVDFVPIVSALLTHWMELLQLEMLNMVVESLETMFDVSSCVAFAVFDAAKF
jgi:hypothetical protein